MINEEKALKILESMSKQLNALAEKIGTLAHAQHKHSLYWLEYSDKIRNLMSDKDFKIMRDEIVNGQEKMMALLKHIDEDRLTLESRLEKLETITESVN